MEEINENMNLQLSSKYIYLTYLSNDRDYKGALMLKYMLQKYNSKYNLACIVLENVSQKIKNILSYNDIILCEFSLNDILIELGFNEESRKHLIDKHYYGKYIIFKLMEYEKIIYLDTDLLLNSSIDELFLLDCNNEEIYMTCDTLMTSENNVKFCKNMVNSGVIVFSPNIKIYDYCYNCLKLYETNLNELSTDQTIFNKSMKTNELNIQYLPYKYNCVWAITNLLENKIVDEVKIIHFILSPKPWDYIDCLIMCHCYSNSSEYILKWIQMYNEMVIEQFHKCFSKNVYRSYNKLFVVSREEEIQICGEI